MSYLKKVSTAAELAAKIFLILKSAQEESRVLVTLLMKFVTNELK